jgi:hypothetical protein
MSERLYSITRAGRKIAYHQGMLKTLRKLELGGGRVLFEERLVKLVIPASDRGYADAQLDDYRGLSRGEFPWVPPLSLSLRARASSTTPLGTLGFGLWNDPFALSLGQGGAARRLPAAPQAAWFFYGSAPNDLSLGQHRPGQGWMAMTMRSRKIPAILLAPPAAAAWLLTKIPPLRRPLFRLMGGFTSIDSVGLKHDLDVWHEYQMDWGEESVAFHVDGELILRSSIAPHPRLGLVIWIDNQYLLAAPGASLSFGVLHTPTAQVLTITDLSVKTSA